MDGVPFFLYLVHYFNGGGVWCPTKCMEDNEDREGQGRNQGPGGDKIQKNEFKCHEFVLIKQ